jgi:hypothetical protein
MTPLLVQVSYKQMQLSKRLPHSDHTDNWNH